LARADEWLAVAQILRAYDPDTLAELGFFERDQLLLERLTATLEATTDEAARPLAESILTRIEQLADGRLLLAAHDALTTIEHSSGEQPWWTPEDLPAPPSSDPVVTGGTQFAPEDVRRVLIDL
jgi:hypothetical protein